MYNIVNDLFYNTCTSGIQQGGLWSNRIIPSSYPDGGDGGSSLSNYTYIDTRFNVIPNSFIVGVKLRCSITENVIIKIAGTFDYSHWSLSDVISISHIGQSPFVSYYFPPFRVPNIYPNYFISLYAANGQKLITSNFPGGNGSLYYKGSNQIGNTLSWIKSDRLDYLDIQVYTSSIVEIPSSHSKLILPAVLTSGSYIGLEFQSQSEIQCSDIIIDTSPTPSGLLKIDYAKFTGDKLSSDGQFNNNTGYATPKMTYHDEPAGYYASASSEVAGYWPYEAFTQTNINESDCWKSTNTQMSGTAPQCLMFTFSGTGKAINRYQILSRNHSSPYDRGFPITWALQATNDTRAVAYSDSYWITLDTRSNVSEPGQNAWTSIFNFDNAQSYRSYRLRITDRYSSGTLGFYHVSIGELKLIEADQVYSYPTFAWYPGDWLNTSGIKHSISFNPPLGLDRFRVFWGNSASLSATVSGISVLVKGTDEINLSGVSPTFRYTFTDSGPLLLDVTNTSSGSAFPRINLQYTGNYEVDRNVFISSDYATECSGDTSTWRGLDYGGMMIPENRDWTLGTLSGTTVYRKGLQLSDTMNSGTWISPVFEIGYNPLRLYTYPTGDHYPKIEVKSADTRPAEAIFSIITTENTHEKLMYKHKRIVLDSNGYVVSRVECNSPQVGNKVWRMATYTFAGQPLNYYGAMNSRGTASFLAPGYTTCGDIDPAQEALDPLKWYNLNVCKLDDTSLWNTGISVSGFEWGPTKSVLYTKTFPLENSEGVFFAAISTSTDQELPEKVRTRVNMGFYNHERVMSAFPIISCYGNILQPEDYYDVVEDYANNGWWVYLGGSISRIYKADVGSFNTIRAFGVGDLKNDTPEDDDDYYGYLYYLDIEPDYKHIVSIPNPNFSGFWAFTSSGICLFKEEYTNEVPSLDNVRQIYSSTIISDPFTELHQGSCDSNGNLWLVDIGSERLVRVNLQRTINLSDPNPIDYDNNISGIINVFPHPTNELAYVLCSASIENPDQDTIQMVSAGQSPGANSQFVCAVPGFLSSPYKRCVNFTGTTFNDYYRVRSSDSTWGLGAGEWCTINNADMLPRGKYTQFKLTLSRTTLLDTTPIVQRLRLPFPVTLEPLDPLQTRQVAIKTVFNRAKTFGIFNTNLLVWWFDEEFYNG
jgi:hypothetical protein